MKYYFYILLFVFTSCSYKVHQHQNTYQINKKGTNFYLVKENNQYLMIDSGTPNNGKKIEKVLLKNNINPKDISYLIVTHAHYDHAGNAKYFQEKYGTKIIVGKGDQEMIENNGEDPHLCPTHVLAKIGNFFVKQIYFDGFTPDLYIEKEYDLKNIGFTGKIIPLAGHTPGSLIIETEEQIFVGDLIRGSLFKSSKPKRHFFMCDLQDNDADIKFVSDFSNNKTWFLGHGGPITNKEAVRFLDKD